MTRYTVQQGSGSFCSVIVDVLDSDTILSVFKLLSNTLGNGIHIIIFWGCPRGVMVKAMDCGIVVREFVL